MQFNSYEFIFLFLPLTIIIYFASCKINMTIGKISLVISSIAFYAWGRKEMVMYLLGSMLINYFFANIIKKGKNLSRVTTAVPVIVNVVLLMYYKYLNFGINNINRIIGSNIETRNIIVPLGISFFTFQQIAYLVAVYRCKIDVDILDYASYILFFPKLLMGPLMDPTDFINQLNDTNRNRIQLDNIAIGLKLFSIGLAKKVILADTYLRAVSWGKNHFDGLTGADCFLIMICYSFEIYFDFSGYSDMATGIAQMLNIQLPINFDSPYKALSIKDFWKRWHISLTKFFTQYIYIPLGGSKKAKISTYLNVIIVFLVSGMWHGAQWTFILWGILHGLLCVIDRIWEDRKIEMFVPFRWLLTLMVVNVLWLLFDAESIGQWVNMLYRISRIDNIALSRGILDVFEIAESRFIFDMLHLNNLYYSTYGFSMIVFFAISGIICFVPQNSYRSKNKLSFANMISAAIFFAWGVISLGGVSNFVYNGF